MLIKTRPAPTGRRSWMASFQFWSCPPIGPGGDTNFRGAMQRFAFSRNLSDRLHELAQRENTSFFTTILAASPLAAALQCAAGFRNRHRHLRPQTLRIGKNARLLPESSGAALEIKWRPKLPRTAGACAGSHAGALSHDDAPFERLVEELSVRRDTSGILCCGDFSLVPPTAAFETGWI